MRGTRRLLCTASAFVLALVSLPVPVSAQSIWSDRSSPNLLAVEFLKPNFEGESRSTFMTSPFIITGRFSLRENLSLVVDLPFSHYGIEDGNESQTGFGNLYLGVEAWYLGVETWQENSHIFYEFGIRLPTASEEKHGAAFIGMVSDYDRFEAFFPDRFSISFKPNYMRKDPASNFIYRMRAGPVLMTGGGDDLDVFIDYGFFLGWEGERAGLTGGLTGRLNASSEDQSISERTVHHAGFQANLIFDRARPGIYLRVPLDEGFQDILDLVVGFQVSFTLD